MISIATVLRSAFWGEWVLRFGGFEYEVPRGIESEADARLEQRLTQIRGSC